MLSGAQRGGHYYVDDVAGAYELRLSTLEYSSANPS